MFAKITDAAQPKLESGDEVTSRYDPAHRAGESVDLRDSIGPAEYGQFGRSEVVLYNLQNLHPTLQSLGITLAEVVAKLESFGSNSYFGETADGRFLDYMSYRGEAKVTTYCVEPMELRLLESPTHMTGYVLAVGDPGDSARGAILLHTNNRTHARQLHAIAVDFARSHGSAAALSAVGEAAVKRGIRHQPFGEK